MPIEFSCPNCHAALRLKDKFAGQRGSCPHCKQAINVPAHSSRDNADDLSLAPLEDLLPRNSSSVWSASEIAPTAPQPPKPGGSSGRLGFHCVHCGGRIFPPAGDSRRRLDCPHCGAVVEVPGSRPEPAGGKQRGQPISPAAASPLRRASRAADADEVDDGVPLAVRPPVKRTGPASVPTPARFFSTVSFRDPRLFRAVKYLVVLVVAVVLWQNFGDRAKKFVEPWLWPGQRSEQLLGLIDQTLQIGDKAITDLQQIRDVESARRLAGDFARRTAEADDLMKQQAALDVTLDAQSKEQYERYRGRDQEHAQRLKNELERLRQMPEVMAILNAAIEDRAAHTAGPAAAATPPGSSQGIALGAGGMWPRGGAHPPAATTPGAGLAADHPPGDAGAAAPATAVEPATPVEHDGKVTFTLDEPKIHEAGTADSAPTTSDAASTDSRIDAVLVELRSGERSRVRAAAIRLHDIIPNAQRAEVAAELVKLLSDTDPTTRNAVAAGLAHWATGDSVPALLALRDDVDGGVRHSAFMALAASEDPRAAKALAERLSGPDATNASSALKQMGASAEDAVLRSLRTGDPSVKTAACGVLQVIGTRKSLQDLRRFSRDKDADAGVRSAADQAANAVQSRAGAADAPAAKPKVRKPLGLKPATDKSDKE